MTTGVLVIFVAVYLGMMLGRFPGLALDRTGIALPGAIAMVAMGAMDVAPDQFYLDGRRDDARSGCRAALARTGWSSAREGLGGTGLWGAVARRCQPGGWRSRGGQAGDVQSRFPRII